MGDLILAGLLLATSAFYVFLRTRQTHPWLERIPFLTDLYIAAFGIATGSVYLCGMSWSVAIGAGSLAVALTAGLALLGWIWSRFPALTGYRPWRGAYPVGGEDLGGAHALVVERLAAQGLRIARDSFPGIILAHQPGNKMAWDFRNAPKTLRVRIRQESSGIWADVVADYRAPVLRNRGEREYLASLTAELFGTGPPGGTGPEEEASPWQLLPPEFVLPVMILFLLIVLGVIAF